MPEEIIFITCCSQERLMLVIVGFRWSTLNFSLGNLVFFLLNKNQPQAYLTVAESKASQLSIVP
jgi:hypothetical protein